MTGNSPLTTQNASVDALLETCRRIVYDVEVLGIHVANVGGYGLAKMVLAALDD